MWFSGYFANVRVNADVSATANATADTTVVATTESAATVVATNAVPPKRTYSIDTSDQKMVDALCKLYEQDKLVGLDDAIVRLFGTYDPNDRNAWTDQTCTALLDVHKRALRELGDDFADNAKLKFHIRASLLLTIGTRKRQFVAKISQLIDKGVWEIDLNALEELDADGYSKYVSFVVYGCPLSTDIDVCVICNPIYNNSGTVRPLFRSEMERLKSDLVKLGYGGAGETREIDYNLIVIRDGQIIASTKGGAETANIIRSTHAFHAQSIDVDALGLKEVELSDTDFASKVRSFAKYVWDYLKYISLREDYDAIHDDRSMIYDSPGQIVQSLGRALEIVVADPTSAKFQEIKDKNEAHWRTSFKTICMKLVQIAVFWKDRKMSYTKEGIAADSVNLLKRWTHPSLDNDTLHQGCLYFLLRGKRGTYDDRVYPYLISIYQEIAADVTKRGHAELMTYDVMDKNGAAGAAGATGAAGAAGAAAAAASTVSSSGITLSDFPISGELLSLFLDSPIDASPEFEKSWTAAHGATFDEIMVEIHHLFTQDIRSTLRTIPTLEVPNAESNTPGTPNTTQAIRNQFIMIAQKSEQWLRLRNTVFICGNVDGTGGTPAHTFQGAYNLIRGCIVEELCSRLCEPLNDLAALRRVVDPVSPHFLEDVVSLRALEVGFLAEHCETPVVTAGTASAAAHTEQRKAAAPDGLLMLERKKFGRIAAPIVVPIEIKALKNRGSTPIENADYRRGLDLASRQVRSICDILKEPEFVMPFGLIVLCWIHERKLVTEVHVVQF